MGELLGRLDRWLFAPGDPRRLAAVRIGLCGALALRLGRSAYVDLAGQPSPLFRPRSFMALLPGMPPRPVVLAVQALGVAAALTAAAGLIARVALPVAWASAVFLGGLTTSLGKVAHNDVLLLLAMVPLLPAPVADAWSFDPLRRGRRAGASPAYGWPVRTALVVVAGSYLLTGLAKLAFSGPAWFLSDNLRWALYASSDAQSAPNAFGLFIADRPVLAHAVAAATLALELSFPLVLLRPRLAPAFVAGAAGLHLSILAAMHLDYTPWILTVAVVLIDWPRVVDRIRPGPG